MTEDLIEREWTYLGRCLTSSLKLGSFWRDHNGKEIVFPKMTQGVIGGVYSIKCDEAGTRASLRTARYLRPARLSDDTLAGYRLADKAAYARSQADVAMRRAKAKNNDIGALTLQEVRDLLVGSSPQRGAVLAVVLSYLRY